MTYSQRLWRLSRRLVRSWPILLVSHVRSTTPSSHGAWRHTSSSESRHPRSLRDASTPSRTRCPGLETSGKKYMRRIVSGSCRTGRENSSDQPAGVKHRKNQARNPERYRGNPRDIDTAEIRGSSAGRSPCFASPVTAQNDEFKAVFKVHVR